MICVLLSLLAASLRMQGGLVLVGAVGWINWCPSRCCRDLMILVPPLTEGERFGELETANGTGF